MRFSRDTCDNCKAAAERLWHGFTGGCKGCCARAAARSPQAFKARKAGDRYDADYRGLLAQFGLTHNDVLVAHQADAIGKEPA